MDPVTIATALGTGAKLAGGINTALSTLKSARELARESKDSDLKDKLSELYDELLELKEDLLVLHTENDSLRGQLAKRARVRRDDEFGYMFQEGDSSPLCPICYERDSKVIHLGKRETWSGGIRRVCGVCVTVFWEQPMSTSSVRRKPYSHDPYS